MIKDNKKSIVVKDHYRGELTKLRCWLSGYAEGRSVPGSLQTVGIPGVDVLRQLIIDIDEAK